MTNTDQAWEFYGQEDPYYGVLSDDKYLKSRLDESTLNSFFALGQDYIDATLTTVREHVDADPATGRALDFGCGVGRLTFPLAKVFEAVVGVDISTSMLDEARRNADRLACHNVEFLLGDVTFSHLTGGFDLVHSFIVFQHIRADRGERIVQQLIDRLNEGGIGILHFTYADATTTPLIRRAATKAYERLPFVYGIRNVLKRQPFRRPPMQMNLYDLSRIFLILQESGCHDVHARFTDASHYNHPIHGVVLYFKKERRDTTTHH